MKRIFTFILAAVMLLSLCTFASAENDVVRDSIVLAEQSSEWWGADVTQLDGTSYFQGLMGEPICVKDAEGNLLPNICSEVSISEDWLTITLTIPEGMYYYNGEQVEPEDVVASLKRIQEVSPFSANFAVFTDIVEDGRNVILTLDHYSTDAYNALTQSFVTVMDKDELESKTDEELYWDCHPYGMYYLKEYVAGAYVVLERNPGFKCFNPFVENQGPALIQEVTVRFITEEFTLAQEFNAGNIQYITGLSADGVAQLDQDKAVVDLMLTNPNVNYIEMKLDDDVIGDEVIRKAIALTINREELCALYNDIIIPAYSFATSTIMNYNAQAAEEYTAEFCNDVEKANALLDEAGYVDTDGDGIREKDGMPLMIKFVYGATPFDTIVSQGLQIQLLDNLGIYLDLNEQEDNFHYESLANGDFQMGMSRFNTPDPVQLFQWVLCYFPSFDYLGDYGCDGEDAYMALCDAMAQEADPSARTAMVYDLEKLVCGSVLVIPVFTNRQNIVYAQGVTPGLYMGDGQVFFNDLQ
jgi:peptide/nickel transport system substrate-binding protein